MATASSQASLLLSKQLRDLAKHPVDGFSAGLVDDSNVFEWQVTIIGPPETLYDGGYFNAIMSFPPNYPNSPPSVRFTSEMWHPNGQNFTIRTLYFWISTIHHSDIMPFFPQFIRMGAYAFLFFIHLVMIPMDTSLLVSVGHQFIR
jgi:hypothetical protein